MSLLYKHGLPHELTVRVQEAHLLPISLCIVNLRSSTNSSIRQAPDEWLRARACPAESRLK